MDKVTITMKIVSELGMALDEWQYESCVARVGVGDNWATIYHIESRHEGQGHASMLLRAMKAHYEKQGKTFGGSVALNDRMHWLYQKWDIKEYTSIG